MTVTWPRAGAGGAPEVPRRPGVAASRAARWCRCAAAPCWTSRAVAPSTSRCAVRRVGQHGQRLVGVRGDHDGVVRRHDPVAVGDLDAVGGLDHGGDLGADAHVGRARRATRRTYSREPPVTVRHVGEPKTASIPWWSRKREEVARGVVERDVGIAGPDRGDERLHEVAGEVRREPARAQELAQRHVVGCSGPLEQRPRPAVEAWDGGEHPQVRRVGEVAGGRDDAAPAERSRPLQPGAAVADGHRHLGVLGRDAELGEQAEQHRVGALVVHDEAGVDGRAARPARPPRGCRRGRRVARRPRRA